ncbi:MAG: endonuclease Q family protein [Planctomycetota bacterium]
MEINADLHSHSGYAGGVGNINLNEIAESMVKKGIHVFGTGDALHPEWNKQLKENLIETEAGLFKLKGTTNQTAEVRFLLQTELIITAAVKTSKGRKNVHVVILIPSFAAIEKIIKLLQSWGSRNTIGRPFLKCDDSDSVSERVKRLFDIEGVELVPAHVMTPQGIYGSDNPIVFLSDFFGKSASLINAVETGLSADPVILNLIPELDRMTLISSSDCHSAASNRLGREYTTLLVKEFSYREILDSIRSNRIVSTAEFNPGEGRYFLTGHRADKQNHNGEYCVFSPDYTPADRICPICGKRVTVGVIERAFELGRAQGEKRELNFKSKVDRNFFRMVPLSEIIAYAIGVGNANSKRVKNIYEKIVSVLNTEAALWKATVKEVEKMLSGEVKDEVVNAIAEVKSGNFTFEPLGFDGEYGALVLGQKDNWFGTNIVKKDKISRAHYANAQKTLFE